MSENVVEKSHLSGRWMATDSALRAYFIRIYLYMSGGLMMTALVAYALTASHFYQRVFATPLYWVILLAPFVLVVLLTSRLEQMSAAAMQLSFWSYACLIGFSLSGLFQLYTRTNIASVFFLISITFAVMSVYGGIAKRDLTFRSSLLTMALIGLVCVSLFNLIVMSSILQLFISLAGVLIFVGLTAADTQRLKDDFFSPGATPDERKDAIFGALTLYLDFLNMFLFVLRLTGRRQR